MKLVFLGTPEFACPSLDALVKAGHDVVGVVTRPDRPAGRGGRIAPPAVKRLALERGLALLQPEKVNRPESVDAIRRLEPDVLVVVAFGSILKKPLLDIAPLGSVNVHASLLPAYRGMAPVQWTLVHGRRTTGVTIMLLDEGMDTGPVLERRVVEVDPVETAGELLGRLALEGASLLLETLRGLAAGTLVPVPQPEEGATYAPGLTKEHGYLDLERGCGESFDQFRGVTPAPGARVFLGSDAVLVEEMRPVPGPDGPPYTVLQAEGRHLRVAAGQGAVDLLGVRPPGRKSMDGAAFARGRKLGPGSRLSPPPSLPDLSVRVAVAR